MCRPAIKYPSSEPPPPGPSRRPAAPPTDVASRPEPTTGRDADSRACPHAVVVSAYRASQCRRATHPAGDPITLMPPPVSASAALLRPGRVSPPHSRRPRGPHPCIRPRSPEPRLRNPNHAPRPRARPQCTYLPLRRITILGRMGPIAAPSEKGVSHRIREWVPPAREV